jgi:hypothetical protein
MSESEDGKLRVYEIYLELLQISNSDPHSIEDEDRSSFMDDKVKPRARELGEELNRISGFSLMQYVCDSMPDYDIRLLECAWDGIGDWMY